MQSTPPLPPPTGGRPALDTGAPALPGGLDHEKSGTRAQDLGRRARQTDWQSLAVLRFFLAWVVLSSHLRVFVDRPAGWILAFDAFGGKAAVVGFLLVSGYSIAASLERSQIGFYRRRFLRIYPLYLGALVFAGVLQMTAGDLSTLNLPTVVNGGSGWFTLAGNVVLLQTFVVKPIAFDGPVWSLAVEAFFYLLAPLFVRLRPKYLIAAVIFSAACYTLPRHTDRGFAYLVLSKLNALHYLWCWLLGFLLRSHPVRAVAILAVLGVAPVLSCPDTSSGLGWLTYLLSVGVIAAATRARMPAVLRRGADYLGDLSYPLYLMHFPAFILALLYLGARTPGTQIAVAFLSTIVAYHLVDGFLKPRFLAPLLLGNAVATAPADETVGRQVA
jgi:peptidoglycan/LPS O-acetylase OafA/YrhL